MLSLVRLGQLRSGRYARRDQIVLVTLGQLLGQVRLVKVRSSYARRDQIEFWSRQVRLGYIGYSISEQYTKGSQQHSRHAPLAGCFPSLSSQSLTHKNTRVVYYSEKIHREKCLCAKPPRNTKYASLCGRLQILVKKWFILNVYGDAHRRDTKIDVNLQT